MITRCSLSLLPFAALASAAPLQAAAPDEIFTRLAAQPAQAAPIVEGQRAAVLPALSYLPADTEAVAAMAQVDRHLAPAVADAQMRGMLRAVGSAAISCGPGSIKALSDFVRINQLLAGCKLLNKMEQNWRPLLHQGAAQQVIPEIMKNRSTQAMDEVANALSSFRLPTIYCAFTPAPGKESELNAAYQELLAMLREQTQTNDSPWKAEEWQGFSGIQGTLSALLGHMLAVGYGVDSRVTRTMAGRNVHVLVKMQGTACLLVVCENPAELTLPTDADHSLLTTPALNGADAHLSELIASVWMSAGFAPSNLNLYEGKGLFLLETLKEIFDKMATADVANSGVYQAAAAGAEKYIASMRPYRPKATRPYAVQVWQQGEDVAVELTSDAQGSHYEPGKLTRTRVAAAEDTMLYMELTGLSVPARPSLEGMGDAAYALSKGVTFCLAEEVQDSVGPHMMLAETFRPDLEAVGQALQTVGSGLAAPWAFVVSAPSTPSFMVPSIAFSAGVKNRAALSEGWSKLLTALQKAGDKVGMGQLVSFLPILPQSLGGSTMNYTLFLPLLSALQPQVTVSDAEFVASTSTKLNQQLRNSGSVDGTPFCGAVGAVRFNAISSYVNQLQGGSKASLPQNPVQAIYYTATEANGVSTIRMLIDMP